MNGHTTTQSGPIILNSGNKIYICSFSNKIKLITWIFIIKVMIKIIFLTYSSFFIFQMLNFIKLTFNFITNVHTRDVLWTGVQIFFALLVLATLSVATIFITIIENIKQAMKHKDKSVESIISVQEEDNSSLVEPEKRK